MSDRAWVEALEDLAKSGALAWLQSDDFELFCFFGFGVILTDDQKKAAAMVFADPESGLFHVWRWGNRSGKTTVLVLLHAYAVWKKWRFPSPRFEVWERYVYRTLHTAPMNKLVGKAWALMEALCEGRAEQQQDKETGEFRAAPLGRFFTCGKSTLPDGSDALWVKCANGAVIDFMSTSDGAARIEGEAWWFISWDEFARQAPVSDVPLLIDQTFLPRSSDHMAPVIMAGTSTEDFDPVYQEIEDMADRNPNRWVFLEAGRGGNFSQSLASIARQRDMSFDPNSVARSIEGGLGSGGKGPFPSFLLDNAFRDLPARTFKEGLPKDWIVAQAFDHALRNDDNVVLSAAMPWPISAERLMKDPILGVCIDIKKSGRSLTPDEQFGMVRTNANAYDPMKVIIDATAEGGLMVYRQARASGYPTEACSFTGRTPGNIRISNKEYGIQALQRLLAYGLDVRIGEDGWVEEWPEPDPGRPFGLIRFPNVRGDWTRLKRQLATYRRDDTYLTQDAAMTAVMLAWWVYRFIDQGSRTHVQKFSMLGKRMPREPRNRRVAYAGR